MQSIHTLIQQLAAAAARGEDNSTLLAIVEELSTKLRAVQSIVDEKLAMHGEADVVTTVTVKNGSAIPKPKILYVPKPPAVIVVEEQDSSHLPQVNTITSIPSAPVPEAADNSLVEIQQPEQTMPPAEAAVEPTPAIAVTPAYETIADPMVKAALRHMDELHAAFMPPAMAPASVFEEVHELPLTAEMEEEAAALEMAGAQAIAEPELPMPTPKEVAEQDERRLAPKELNEKLAQRSKVLNELFSQPEPVLAEKVLPGKIVDLRKAISIHEKYQFIQSLFRGDEQMFERSVKTLNGFEILAEAQYWMQRELQIKLGWNEDDELVQQFVLLVKKRFA